MNFNNFFCSTKNTDSKKLGKQHKQVTMLHTYNICTRVSKNGNTELRKNSCIFKGFRFKKYRMLEIGAQKIQKIQCRKNLKNTTFGV